MIKKNLLFFFLIVLGCNSTDQNSLSNEERTKLLMESIMLKAQEKNYSEAIPLAKELIEINPNVIQYQQILIGLKFESGQLSQSEALQQTQQLAKSHQNKRLSDGLEVAISISGDMTEESILLIKRKIEDDPNYYQNHYYLGQAYMKLERYEDAISAFNKSIELEPYYKYAYAERGMAHYKMGNKEKACEEWQTPGGGSINYREKYCE